jgi:hypothetical protein
MGDILTNLTNKVQYKLRELTYDPEAEKYAESAAASKEANAAAAAAKKAADDKKKTDTEQKEAADKAAAAANAEREAKAKFSTSRMTGKVAEIVGIILLCFLLVIGGIYGSSLATNLNVYRSWPYRLLYSIYGFIFFPVVVIYVLGYRWFWLGRKPRYYSLVPLVPEPFKHPILQTLLGWMTYTSDDAVHALEEWNPDRVKLGQKQQELDQAEEAIEAAEAEATE